MKKLLLKFLSLGVLLLGGCNPGGSSPSPFDPGGGGGEDMKKINLVSGDFLKSFSEDEKLFLS